MTAETIEGTAVEVTESRALVSQPGNALVARPSDGPAEMIGMASKLASALKDVVERQKLYTVINGKKFPQVEAWMTIGRMDNVVAREAERPIRNEDGSYEGFVELVRLSDGMVIGRASALCGTPDDAPWGGSPATQWKAAQPPRSEPARRSMAVTRATSRAFRQQYSWIMALAGYEPTPAEEMPRDETPATPPATVNGGPPPEHPPVIPPNVETETLIGEFSRKSATVRRRDARTPIEALQGPDGHVIALRLEMGSEKSIPQVVIAGDAGEALYLATSMKPDTLVGQNLSVRGMLMHVAQPGKRSYNRLHVREWATADYAYPAETEPTLPEPPPDVALVGERPEAAPLFDDVAVAS